MRPTVARLLGAGHTLKNTDTVTESIVNWGRCIIVTTVNVSSTVGSDNGKAHSLHGYYWCGWDSLATHRANGCHGCKRGVPVRRRQQANEELVHEIELTCAICLSSIIHAGLESGDEMIFLLYPRGEKSKSVSHF